ncbi:hypothetical protein BKA93DRAFT_535188 [Sparassis latifolia]
MAHRVSSPNGMAGLPRTRTSRTKCRRSSFPYIARSRESVRVFRRSRTCAGFVGGCIHSLVTVGALCTGRTSTLYAECSALAHAARCIASGARDVVMNNPRATVRKAGPWMWPSVCAWVARTAGQMSLPSDAPLLGIAQVHAILDFVCLRDRIRATDGVRRVAIQQLQRLIPTSFVRVRVTSKGVLSSALADSKISRRARSIGTEQRVEITYGRQGRIPVPHRIP